MEKDNGELAQKLHTTDKERDDFKGKYENEKDRAERLAKENDSLDKEVKELRKTINNLPKKFEETVAFQNMKDALDERDRLIKSLNVLLSKIEKEGLELENRFLKDPHDIQRYGNDLLGKVMRLALHSNTRTLRFIPDPKRPGILVDVEAVPKSSSVPPGGLST